MMDTSTPAIRVLIVDDDDDVRESFTLLLADEGFEIAEASNGAQAMRAIEAAPPDVILLDLMMPVMNGWKLWEWLRASPATAHIPVVVLTASGTSEVCGDALVLTKPVGVHELTSALAAACAA